LARWLRAFLFGQLSVRAPALDRRHLLYLYEVSGLKTLARGLA